MADKRSIIVSSLLGLVERFQLDVVEFTIPSKPEMLSESRLVDRRKHLREELNEFIDAATLEEQADALVDLAYVALGGLVQMGICPGPAFEAVHEANMRRVKMADAAGHKLGVGKPEGWEPPDLLPYLTVSQAELLALYSAKCDVGASSLEVVACKEHGHGCLCVSQTERIEYQPAGGEGAASFEFPAKATGPTKMAIFDDSEAAMIAKKRRKFPLFYVPYVAVQMASRVFAFGAAKYSRDGYKTVDYKFSELISATMRHCHEFMEGKDYDVNAEGRADRDHSGEPIIGHILCCAMMLAWRWAFKRGVSDDRTFTEQGLKAEWPK